MDYDSAPPSCEENSLLNEDESLDSDASQPNVSALLRKKVRRSEGNYKKRKRGRSRSTGPQSSVVTKSKLNYKCSNFIKEDHKQPIFGCQFYQYLGDPEDDPLLFGTVGSNRVSVYRCGEDCGRMNLYQSYADADPEEIFYSCTWTTNEETGHPLLCFAGAKGIIHVLNPIIRQFVRTFQGHGAAVNELKTHPLDSTLIISTSKDHTIRLWNIKTECCVAIFAGVEGHRDEVLGIDFDIMGRRLVSCGMDHSLKFWSLEKPRIKKAIEDSHNYSIEENRKTFPTLAVHYPEFTTRDVHLNYVDCCVWLGDLVLSKSCDNQVVCWKAKEDIDTIMRRTNHKEEVGVFVLHKFDITDCDIWFIRFAVDYNQSVLALGNQVGKIMLYDLQVEHPANAKPTTLYHNRCTSAVRQISFNTSAKILIAVCDDGSIWRWDKQT